MTNTFTFLSISSICLSIHPSIQPECKVEKLHPYSVLHQNEYPTNQMPFAYFQLSLTLPYPTRNMSHDLISQSYDYHVMFRTLSVSSILRTYLLAAKR